MSKSPENNSPENDSNNSPEKSFDKNAPENRFAFLKCPKCKEHTLMQKNESFFKCDSCGHSKTVKLAQREQTTGDLLGGFSGMVVIAVILLALLSVSSSTPAMRSGETFSPQYPGSSTR